MGSAKPRRASRDFDFRRPRDAGAGRHCVAFIGDGPFQIPKVREIVMFGFAYPMEAARVALEAHRLMVLSFLGLPSGQQRREEGGSDRKAVPSIDMPKRKGPSMETPKTVEPSIAARSKTASARKGTSMGMLKAAEPSSAARQRTASARKATRIKKKRGKGKSRRKVK